MSPLQLITSVIEAIKAECFYFANKYGIFLEQDEAGNIWLGEGGEECYRVRGWCLTYKNIKEIIKKKELEKIE